MTTKDELSFREGEPYYLNMGPQHPSMHGVLRMRLHLLGEKLLEAEAIIGYAHRAQEKMAENRNFFQFLPQTSRLDYLGAMIYNIAYCEMIEKAVGITVPERALYIRTIVSELNRISSHLLWIAAFLLDIGGITVFLYGFDDREQITDLLESVSGSRLTYSYGRFGGVSRDVDESFLQNTTAFIARMRKSLLEYKTLIRGNVIFQNRCRGVGILTKEHAIQYALAGPTLRSVGINSDVRKNEPYGIYDRFEFDIPTSQEGDVLSRYDLRIREIEESLKIIEQAIKDIPKGPYIAKKTKKRIKLPKGRYYHAVESPRGLYGMYIVSDGTEKPYRMKIRTPSFSNLSSMPEVLRGTMIADTIAIIGSIDIVLPEIDR